MYQLFSQHPADLRVDQAEWRTLMAQAVLLHATLVHRSKYGALGTRLLPYHAYRFL